MHIPPARPEDCRDTSRRLVGAGVSAAAATRDGTRGFTGTITGRQVSPSSLYNGLHRHPHGYGSGAPKTEPAALESSETKALPPAAAGSPFAVPQSAVASIVSAVQPARFLRLEFLRREPADAPGSCSRAD